MVQENSANYYIQNSNVAIVNRSQANEHSTITFLKCSITGLLESYFMCSAIFLKLRRAVLTEYVDDDRRTKRK